MSAAAQQPAPTQPPTQPPPQPGTVTQTPGQPPRGAQPTGLPSTPAPPTAPACFTAPAGLIFNTVRPDRVDDFEKAMGYLQAALASSTNERVREQAAGWRVFKATRAGAKQRRGVHLSCSIRRCRVRTTSLGRILADAYPDQAKLQEIWKLYSGSVTGGSLLNLTPLKPQPNRSIIP